MTINTEKYKIKRILSRDSNWLKSTNLNKKDKFLNTSVGSMIKLMKIGIKLIPIISNTDAAVNRTNK